MSEIIDELLADAGERMHKSVESTNVEFASVRTGRASPALLDRAVVDYYGVPTVSHTHLRAHETVLDLVCRLLLEKKNKTVNTHSDFPLHIHSTAST